MCGLYPVWPKPCEWIRFVQLILIKIYSASYLFMVLVTKLPVAEPTGVHEMNGKDVKGSGSSLIWDIPTFARRDLGGSKEEYPSRSQSSGTDSNPESSECELEVLWHKSNCSIHLLGKRQFYYRGHYNLSLRHTLSRWKVTHCSSKRTLA